MTARIYQLRQRAIDSGADFDNTRAEAKLARSNDEHRNAKRELMITILLSKKKCWMDLLESVERDPFGKLYKMVMRKLGGGPPATVTMEPQCLRTVVDTLFPTHDVTTELHEGHLEVRDSELFLTQEVNDAIDAIRARNKGPGQDAITSQIIWSVNQVYPQLFITMLKNCITNGTFPTRWKEAQVVLLRKGNKPEGVPSSYRPLCLLNDVEKVLERLLNSRLQKHIDLGEGLAANQYGFRKILATDDAVQKLQNTVADEVNNGYFCVAVSIDIKNAFNSIR